MKQVVEPEPQRPAKHSGPSPLVFLDTSVIIDYLRGEAVARQLLSAGARRRARYAINPIVLQLLLAADARVPEFGRIRNHLRLLPLDFPKAEAMLKRMRELGYSLL